MTVSWVASYSVITLFGSNDCCTCGFLASSFVSSIMCASVYSPPTVSYNHICPRSSPMCTGHLDGTVCLWDMRQSRAGSQALFETRDQTQTILSITNTDKDGVVLTAAKDNVLRLWDYRSLSVVKTLKASGFVIGHIGAMGKGKCHAELSADGRYAVAGSADGMVSQQL